MELRPIQWFGHFQSVSVVGTPTLVCAPKKNKLGLASILERVQLDCLPPCPPQHPNKVGISIQMASNLLLNKLWKVHS